MSELQRPARPASLFPKLKSGPKAMSAGEVAAHQQARLSGAMIAAVARRGYPATTVDELGALAGVSKRDFYRLFSSKQECFFATFEQLTDDFAGHVERAATAAVGLRDQATATIEALADVIETAPGAVALVLVDSLTVGEAADDPRRRSQERFATLLQAAFAQMPEGEVSALTARAIVVGIRRLAYRTIRDRTPQRLRRAAPALADWIVAYAQAPSGPDRIMTPAVLPQRPPASELDWEEPPAGPIARMELSQRERIMRAIAQLVCEDGYGKLTIPAISATAGTSNQTFYAEFGGKEEAFLAGFDALAEEALEATRSGIDAGADWPTRAEEALASYLAHLQSERLFAELAYLELPAMGRAGLERLDVFMDELAGIFEADAPVPKPSDRDELVSAAIVGGVWGAIRQEIMSGKRTELTALQPALIRFVSVGFGS
jgi:AcrR family transcriptional regulator